MVTMYMFAVLLQLKGSKLHHRENTVTVFNIELGRKAHTEKRKHTATSKAPSR